MKVHSGQPCVMVVAGEASGDQHGARLVAEMRRSNPNIFFCGIGGREMAAAGVRILIQAAELAVVGITEVFAKLPVVFRSLALVKKLLQSLKPDLLILIDFPDFNLRVAAGARKLGIPVLYYISPQIWAWRRGRVKKIGKLVSHMAVILPFEAVFYADHGIPVTFVGHPLLDRGAAKEEKGASSDTIDGRTRIGLLPGSRAGEIERLLPVMLAAAAKMIRQDSRLAFTVSVAPSVEKKTIVGMIERCGAHGAIDFSEEPVERLFKRCRLVVAASGTVTLQAAIAGTPMVIIYKVSPVSYWLGRALIRVDHIGLINLIAGRRLVPELVQDQATAAGISRQVFGLLADDNRLARLKSDLLAAAQVLGGPGASRQVAQIALCLMDEPAKKCMLTMKKEKLSIDD
ncbi:MAG: lipid-A-disaccharide synthase [Desulfobacterales bacterium]